MALSWIQMMEAYADAERTIDNVDSVLADMARMLSRRLHFARHRIPGDVLARLKRELRDYDIHRQKWVR